MYLGIDFGTSFSEVATMDDFEQPWILKEPFEKYAMPSEFYYDEDNGILIGEDAEDMALGSASANLVSEVKMDLFSGKSFTLDGKTFTAKRIVEEIYKALVRKAIYVACTDTRVDNRNIEGIVISIPAKFGIQERFLIKEAAKDCLKDPLLGLGSDVRISAIIKEPVAAALRYYNYENIKVEDNKYILVYDLGGGTCDIALVRSDSSVAEHYTVVDSDMLRIGGKDWDKELIGYMIQKLEKESGITIHGNIGFEEKVRRAAIDAKHKLSDPLKDFKTARVELNGKIFSLKISKNVFEELTSHLLVQTLDLLQDVYERNKYECDINEIICVGGSSNMPQVKDGLKKYFPNCSIKLFEPEYAVVYGAAFYANVSRNDILNDIASFSYGTAVNTHYGYPDNKKVILNILKLGMKLPAENSECLVPVSDNQEYILYDIYESEFTDEKYDISCPDKRFVGSVRLMLPPNSLKTLKTTCQLTLGTDGMLYVKASEPSGKKIEACFYVDPL